MGDARRNVRLLVLFSISLYAPLYWPYMLYFVCEERGLSAVEFGTLKAIYYASVIAFELPGGMFADRYGRRLGLAACALLNALGCFAYAWARGFWGFAACEFILALSTALLSGADSALLHDSLHAEGKGHEYPQAESRIRSAAFVAMAVALVLSDFWLVPLGGPALTYLATGVLALVGVGAAFALREPARQRTSQLRILGRSALHEVVSRPAVLTILLYTAGIYVLARAANSALFNPVLKSRQIAVDRYGSVTIGISVVGALVAYRSAGWVARYGERRVLLCICSVAAALYASMAWAPGLWVVAAFALQGSMISLIGVLTPVAFNREIASSHHRATLLSLPSIASRGAYAVASPLIGWGLDRHPLPAAIGMTALLGGLPLGLAFLLRRRRTDA